MSLKTAKTAKASSEPAQEQRINEIQADKVPVLEEPSLDQFRKILSGKYDKLEFDDNLKTFSLSGHEIGVFNIKVKRVIYKNEDCFHIVAKSSGTLDNVPCGTEISAYVNNSLETIEQEHHEYIKYASHPLDRKTFITRDTNNYIINQVTTESNNTSSVTFSIMKSLMFGFIAEGSNLLLQRLMIQNNVIEKFSLFTFDVNVQPCLVNYKPLDKREVKIGEQLFDITGLERTIDSSSELTSTWQTYFSNDGHIINRVQVGSPAVMKAVEPPKAIEMDEYLIFPKIQKKELDYENDPQLYSEYQDRKDELSNEYNQYLENHPELKYLLSDYLQSVLSHKPTDLVSFSAEFFAPYSSKTSTNRLFPAANNPQNIPKH